MYHVYVRVQYDTNKIELVFFSTEEFAERCERWCS